MPTPAEFTAALEEIDSASTALAVVLDDLRKTISTSMTPAEVSAAQARLTSSAAFLRALAHDPTDPVPEDVPV